MTNTPRMLSHGTARQLLLALCTTVVVTFTIETLVMLLLHRLPQHSEWTEALMDSTLLAILAFPALYVFVLVPLARHDAKRANVERALAESEAQYRSLVKAVPGVLYVYSDKRAGVYYSPQVESVLGYTADYLRAHPTLWHDSIHPDDLPGVDAAIHTGSQQIERTTVEYRIRNAGGEWRWLRDRFVRVTTHKSGETAIEGLAVDITES